MWYDLGLSHRGIEVIADLLVYGVAQVASWREVQRLGRVVRWCLPVGWVRIAAVDETRLRVRGQARPVGVVVVRDGRMLMSQLVRELPADGDERLQQWARGPALPRELRRLVVHLPERWRQMTLHQREPGVPNTTNWLEGRFGRIKPRYRLHRGLKSAAGAANFMAVLGDVLQ